MKINSKKRAPKAAIKIGILGATGKMGLKIEGLIRNDPVYSQKFRLAFLASGPQDPRFDLLSQAPPDVLVDFSAPPCSLEGAKACGKLKVPMIVCTTGFTKKNLQQLNSRLKRVPWILAANTSVGVFSLKESLRKISKVLNPEKFSVDIIEFHHSQKKDAPSGTALSLAECIISSQPQFNVKHHSIRGGTEVGEHQIHFLGPDERIEITHRAQDRSLFAHGALKLAEQILSLKAKGRPYSPDEVFSL